MQVFVKTLSGKTIVLEDEKLTPENVIAFASEGAEIQSLRLMCAGSEVSSLSNESELYIEWDAEGGKKKKRKKKAFTSKKRVPHTRKKEKLKILKLFKVKDGNVEPTHKECPNCPGCFMAKHKDGRLYCGNCHFTEKKGK